MANVLVENATLQSIADAIRNKTGKTETMLPAEMPAEISGIETGGGYEQGYEDGKNSVVQVERLARALEIYSLNEFGKSTVELNLECATTFSSLVYVRGGETANTTVEHIIINCPNKIESFSNMFNSSAANDQTLKRITLNIENHIVSNPQNAFRGMRALEIIDGTPLNISTSTVNATMFHTCYSLVEVRFAANSIKANISFSYSDKLSTETIQSIIDGLADLTGGTAQTLDFHADVVLKLTDEQVIQIYNKNWTVL